MSNMSNAWETTIDDIANVLERNGVDIDYDMEEWKLEEICDFQIDHIAVEKAALHGLDLEEQTKYAYREIENQLGLIKRS